MFLKSFIISLTCLCMRFVCGLLIGALVWKITVEPYTRYFSFGPVCPIILSAICLSTATLFAVSRWLRSVMVLFLPSMVSNASQNYIIMLLFINLFSGPAKSVALNAVESIRVIGCSSTLTFEHLKDRAKVIMAPMIEILTGSIKDDINSMRDDLMEIQKMVTAMKNEAEFSRNNTDLLKISPSMQQEKTLDDKEILNDIQQRIQIKDQNIVDKAKELIQSSKLEIDGEKLALKASVDAETLNQLLRANMSASIDESNITKILHESCLGVFRGAKEQCTGAIDEMRQSCQNSVGYLLSDIFCSPVLFTLEKICPWVLDQVIDEKSICNTMQTSMANISMDSYNFTIGQDINIVYKNLTDKLARLNDDMIKENKGSQIQVPNRLELSISINDETLRLLLKTRELWLFITDKYKWRRAFFELLLFLYEIYTSFTFLCILMQAIKYQRNYLRDIKFDNNYVTGMFRQLDYRRKMAKKESVLPLTRDESERYIPTLTCKRRTGEERKSQKASCTVILLFLMVALSLMYIDDIFYSILQSIHEHALIKYRELGHHKLQVNIHGEGPLARVAKQLAVHLNTSYDLNKYSSTSQCLPQPESTSIKLYVSFIYLMFAYIFIDQTSIYAMRFRRLTVAFFYTEKEQQRIAYLFNWILVNRRKLKRDGLSSLVNDDDDDDGINRNRSDKDIFTMKDAMIYMKNCARDSFCCGISRCFNIGTSNNEKERFDRKNDRIDKAKNLAPVIYKLLSGTKKR